MSRLPVPQSSSPTDSDGSLVPAQVALAAKLLADAFSGESCWQSRRVERVAFDGDRAKRTISLDADVPSAEHQIPLPIAIFSKNETVAKIEMRDEQNRALPMLTRGEAGAVGYVALQLAVANTGEQLSSKEDALLLDLVMAPQREARAAHQQLCASRPAWLSSKRIATLAELLVHHTVLFALLDTGGKRRVLQLSWEEIVRGGGARTFGASILGRRGRLLVAFHGLPASASSHFEVTAPYGTEITEMTRLDIGKEIGTQLSAGSRAQLHVPASPDTFTANEVLISLGPASSVLGTATGVASGTLLALTVAAISPDIRTNSAILLSCVGVAITILLCAAALVRSRDTSFASQLALGPLLIALLPVLMIGGLLLAGLNKGHLAPLLSATTVSALSLLALSRGMRGERRALTNGEQEAIESGNIG